MASTQFKYNFLYPDLNRKLDANYPVFPPPFLRLTKTDDQGTAPEQNSKGLVLYSNTVQFRDTTNFSTAVKFIITTNGNFPPGDGLAFFIVPEGHDFPPPTGGNLGIFSPGEITADVFGVALDFGYLKDRLCLGICIGSRVPKKYVQVDKNGVLGTQLTLKVSYVANTTEISASLAVGDNGPYYQVSFPYKLTDILPGRVSVGLASSTSKAAAAIHDVNHWEFNSTAP